MDGSKMTRIQEIPWLDKVPSDEKTTQSQKRFQYPGRLNLYQLPWLRPLIESRWPQLLVRIVTLSGFVFTIAGGLFGPLVGSHNFAIIFVWIAWWTALKLVFIPFGGRSWCSVCPIPLPGDWLQQGGVLEPGPRRFGLNLRWPKRLRGSWIQSGGFLLIGLFSAVTLTDPHVTGWVLLGLFGLAIGLSLVFEKRAFCTYLCPIGGFSGMYAQTSPVEVRIIQKEICVKHEVKSCYHACPWGLYPVAFRDSSACGLCMECLRACPSDNLALNLRPFGTDLGRQKTISRLDETFLALVMLGSVVTFAAVFTGPWGWLKTAAFEIGSLAWVGYASAYLALNLLLLPAIFSTAVWAGQKFSRTRLSLKRAVATQAQVLLPLGLMAWIAFTVSFALPKLNLVLGVLNDPFGWGWHLLGLTDPGRMVNMAGISTILQVMLLLVGLFWSVRVSRKLSVTGEKKSIRMNLPVLAFSLILTLVMLWLLVG
jgi:ferredoxin